MLYTFVYLKHRVDFTPLFAKERTQFDFLFDFLYIKPLLKNRSTLKGKALLQRGAFSVDIFSEG